MRSQEARPAQVVLRGQMTDVSGRSRGPDSEPTGATRRPKKRRAAMADGNATQITTKLSPRSVAETVSRLTGLLAAKSVKVFAVIDQTAEASQVGMELRETTLVVFGNPAAGTPVMAAAPLAALDLPLKILVWADGSRTNVAYYAPAAIAERYGLSAELAAELAGVDPLTDAL